MTKTNEVRDIFLEYFKSKNHEINSSSSLVPANDPTLLFTNAGMVQFKNYFTGIETVNQKRIVTSQKCVRAGGKHNDLDNVGYTHRHHTFFEMLGNFSFGDYFKEGAIEFAWELITREFKIPKDKLVVTVFHEDDEAFKIWKKVSGLSDHKIIKIDTHDNFWSMGDTGPCGPCSEIFYDHGDHISGGLPGSLDEDGDRFVEIWNLVFMQYDQKNNQERIELPNPSIDTGMGLERMTAVLNSTHSNFDTDIFQSIIHDISEIIKKKPSEDIASYRVIADHLRSTAFLIADGVLPSNEGRGYVLRRICRRATRHADLIGYKEPLLNQLLPSLIRVMGDVYPELENNKALIEKTLQYEETKFRETLGRGLKILNDELESHPKSNSFSGETAFKLYDTYGFPIDLTEDLLRAKNISIDIDTFNKEMDKQKKQNKSTWKGLSGSSNDEFYFRILNKYSSTTFMGYQSEEISAKILSIIMDDKEVNKIEGGQSGTIILDQTVFYAESGGQISDIGEIISLQNNAKFIVTDVQKVASALYLHKGSLKKGSESINNGQSVNLHINKNYRNKISRNHSATHLLHESLRLVLGDHISQKGSLVNDLKLRFDFSHQLPISDEDILKIEKISNDIVMQNQAIETKIMTTKDALKTGARALFGEKYGSEVRVVSMGSNKDHKFSVELCGGTHANFTGDIGPIKIMAEQGVSSGVRRIEAITGQETIEYLSQQNTWMTQVKELLNVQSNEIPKTVDQLLKQKRAIEKELESILQKDKFQNITEGLEENLIGKIKLIYQDLENVSPKELRQILDDTKARNKNAIIILIGGDNEKRMIIVGVTDSQIKKYSANKIIQIISKFSDIRGGGRDDMAQAGGSVIAEKKILLAAIEKYIKDQG
jgi:alanyl-tRNA synthetase